MYVVGGHGYVGSRIVSLSDQAEANVRVVSKRGGEKRGVSSQSWEDFIGELASSREPTSIIWLLDGAKHDEATFLRELLKAVDPTTYIAAVSSCTVYGDRRGQMSDEGTPIQILTSNARLKSDCENTLQQSEARCGIFRLGALYGVDDRGVRQDRIEKWVTEAAQDGRVSVPNPSHWRGWLHRDQAARTLLRAATSRVTGVFNVVTSNYTFSDIASFAAAPFGATVERDSRDDPLNYQVNAARAKVAGLLDEEDGESPDAAISAFIGTYSELHPVKEY